MKLHYQKSQSFNRPELIDTTSSKTSVYLRQNIVEKKYKDEITDADIVFYEYDEAKLTKAEYEQYLKELEMIDIQRQRADIDYLAMMMGIEL